MTKKIAHEISFLENLCDQPNQWTEKSQQAKQPKQHKIKNAISI